jgi:hypothetical protein
MTANDESEAEAVPNKKKAKKKARRTKKAATATTKAASRGRISRPYPACAFRDALAIGKAIMKVGGGERVRRLTLLEKIEMSESSSTTRQAITNSGKYGITQGSYAAEWLSLTDLGRKVVDPSTGIVELRQAEFQLAIANIESFNYIYEEYKGKRLPDRAVIKDFLGEKNLEISYPDECVDTFIVNAKDLGLIRSIAGADTLVPAEQVLEELASTAGGERTSSFGAMTSGAANSIPKSDSSQVKADWDEICFYITPIGSEGSDERRHADAIMNALVEPALRELGLRVVRADQIGKAGMITSQILEYIRRSKLAVADLSFLNPNVFYEVALRHACRLPVVQLIRKADRLPFDVGQVRTVVVDTTDAYALVPHLEVLRAEIANQARSAIADPGSVGNPVSIFFPSFYPVG